MQGDILASLRVAVERELMIPVSNPGDLTPGASFVSSRRDRS